MADEDRITEVASRIARCPGAPGKPHAVVEVAVEPRSVAACPICGRRFRSLAPVQKIDPAAWPKEG